MLSWLWSKLNNQKVFIGDTYFKNDCEYTVLNVNDDHMFLVDGRVVTIQMTKYHGDDCLISSTPFDLYELFIKSTFKLINNGVLVKECSDE